MASAKKKRPQQRAEMLAELAAHARGLGLPGHDAPSPKKRRRHDPAQAQAQAQALTQDREQTAPGAATAVVAEDAGPALPAHLEELARLFSQLETIAENLEARGAAPLCERFEEALGTTRRRLAQLVAVAPLYRFARRDADLLLLRCSLPAAAEASALASGPAPVLPAWRQREQLVQQRRSTFRAALGAQVAAAHARFLASLSSAEPRGHRPGQWHPLFDPQAVPEPDPAPVPAPLPRPSATAALSARSAQGPVRAHGAPDPAEAACARAASAPVPEELRGLPVSLIERIRRKEAAAAASAQAHGPAERHRRSVLASLPRLAEVLRSLCAAEKGPAVAVAELLPRLHTALQHTSREAVQEQLAVLAALVPEWASLVPVVQEDGEARDYLHLDRSQSFASVKEKLAAASAAAPPVK